MFVALFPNSETLGPHILKNNCLWYQSPISRWSISHCPHYPCVWGPSSPFSPCFGCDTLWSAARAPSHPCGVFDSHVIGPQCGKSCPLGPIQSPTPMLGCRALLASGVGTYPARPYLTASGLTRQEEKQSDRLPRKFSKGIYLAAVGLSSYVWDLVPWPRMKPRSLALGTQSPSHWITREVPEILIDLVKLVSKMVTSHVWEDLPTLDADTFTYLPIRWGKCEINLHFPPFTNKGEHFLTCIVLKLTLFSVALGLLCCARAFL